MEKKALIGRKSTMVFSFLIICLVQVCLCKDAISLDKELDLHKKSAIIVNEINAHYYSYKDKNVNDINWTYRDSDVTELIKDLLQIGETELAKKVNNVDIIVAYKPLTGLLDVKVENMETFDVKEPYKSLIEAFFDTRPNVIRELWDSLDPYLNGLIDLNNETVESIQSVGEDLIVEIANQEGGRTILRFDKKYYLKSKDIIKPSIKYRETFDFEIYEDRYLVKGIELDGDIQVKVKIEYQLLNRINIGNKGSTPFFLIRGQLPFS